MRSITQKKPSISLKSGSNAVSNSCRHWMCLLKSLEKHSFSTAGPKAPLIWSLMLRIMSGLSSLGLHNAFASKWSLSSLSPVSLIVRYSLDSFLEFALLIVEDLRIFSVGSFEFFFIIFGFSDDLRGIFFSSDSLLWISSISSEALSREVSGAGEI